MDLPGRRTIFYGFLVVLALLLTGPFIVAAVPQTVGVDHTFVVLSSSMEPTIPAGAVVFVETVESDRVNRGDIITFGPRVVNQEDAEVGYITHRVVDVVRTEDGLFFRTKGDANEDPDPKLVASDLVAGQVQFYLPYLGYAILFIKSRIGIILFLIIPSVLLAGLELRSLVATNQANDGTGGSTER